MKIKLKDSGIKPTNALVYFIYILVACIIGLAVSSVVALLVSGISNASYLALAIVRTFVFMAAEGGALFLLGYREGYRDPEVDIRPLAYSWGVAYAIHLAVSLVASFAPVLSGGARYMAGWMYLGDEFTAMTAVSGGLYGYCVLAYFIYLAVNTACFMVACFLGADMRLRSRAELTANQAPDVSEAPTEQSVDNNQD